MVSGCKDTNAALRSTNNRAKNISLYCKMLIIQYLVVGLSKLVALLCTVAVTFLTYHTLNMLYKSIYLYIFIYIDI